MKRYKFPCRICTKELRNPEYQKNCSILCGETVLHRLQELNTPDCLKYLKYLQLSNMRNKEFELTIKQYWDIKQNPCYYCGNQHNIGIDRLDNTKGYTVENSVPCCYMCNMMKNTMSEDQLINQCVKILRYRENMDQTT